MKDDLGDRMKSQYENRTRYYLPRRTYTIIRIDGKAFHSYTKGFKRPYDEDLIYRADETTKYLCENIQGAVFGYVQSDEISILLTDFAKPTTSAWFDGNIQKIVSVSASMATMRFNQLSGDRNFALFDSRVFTIPDPIEVENYFIWREGDCTRNSITMAAQSYFSHKQLQGKSTAQMLDMLMLDKGINWNDYPARFKRGGVVVKTDSGWQIVDPPIFTQDRIFLRSIIPEMLSFSDKTKSLV